MALIKCSNCGKEISDKANLCPKCGYELGKAKNKNKIIIAIILIILFIIGAVVINKSIISKYKIDFDKNIEEKKKETELDKKVKVYYEDFFYTNVGSTDNERVEFVKQYYQIGIKVNVSVYLNFLKTQSELDAKEFEKEYSNYDLEKSIITYYPTSPYGKKDYTYEISLVKNIGKEE